MDIPEGLVEGKDYVKIEDGAVIFLKPVPPLAPTAISVAYERKHPKPEPPQYEMEAAGGVSLSVDHDETTVSTKEEKRLWRDYVAKKKEWETQLNTRIMRLFWGEGVTLEATDEVKDKWNKKLVMYGIIDSIDELPDDETELQVLYLESFGLTSKAVLQSAMKGIMGFTGLSEADLEAADKLF